MPDTFTHIALPALFSKFYRAPLIVPILLIGTLLPDYLREFAAFILPPASYPSVIPLHSLGGIFITSLFFASLFRTDFRKQVFISLFCGQLLHLFFDLLQFYLCGGQLFLFFPYWKAYRIGLFSESYWLIIFIFSLIFLTAYILINLRNKHHRFL